MLKRKLSLLKWVAVFLLFLGVITSQSSKIDAAQAKPGAKVGSAAPSVSSYVIGIGLTLALTTISSSAGVYSEWILKRRFKQSFFLQNGQLYAYGVGIIVKEIIAICMLLALHMLWHVSRLKLNAIDAFLFVCA